VADRAFEAPTGSGIHFHDLLTVSLGGVGVIEHVGVPNYPAFFGSVRERLEDGGLYLNHGIVHHFHWKPSSQTEFLYRHVFPNGDLAGLSETLTEIERAGFEIETRTAIFQSIHPALVASEQRG